MLPKTYSYLVTRTPIIWALYYHSRKLPLFRTLNREIIRRTLQPNLVSEEADAELAIITHPMYCNFIADLKRIAAYVIVMPTDLFGSASEWFAPDATLYVVASQEMMAHARQAGIPASRIIVRRLPTSLPIAATIKSMPRSSPPCVLVIGGAEGVGPIWKVTSGLTKARCRPVVTVACGNNRQLASSISKDFPEVHFLPFSPDLANTFQQYDLIITKPGSLTLQEVANVGIPFLWMPGVPGLETHTRNFCQRSGIPSVGDAQSARVWLDKLLDHSGSPLPEWYNLIRMCNLFRDALPKKSFSLDDLSGIL